MTRKLLGEALGTLWLVLGGCGSAVLALGFPDIGIGLLGVALAFGFAWMVGVHVFEPVSGAHLNPAVTVGMAVAGRFPLRLVVPYILAQVVGAIAGAAIVSLIASGKVGFDVASGLDANGYAEHSPGAYSLASALVCETVLGFLFVLVVLRAREQAFPAAYAPLVTGLALVVVCLVGIPVTNASVNPARSLGPAVFVGGWALQQLWLFWLAPLLGAGLAGGASRYFGIPQTR
jgi:aquaporin Z